ncbi:F0F1 ATP synthase subunit gamma [Comamonadaceae bacterium G21597-S1]|nr:F0F1 ATP synthase subunit gamma [Comamonadaceae bacterium G21597-S1]
MSDGLAQLRHTMASAGDLQSVVRTMKALAAASIGQYEQSVRALAQYHHTVALGLGACLRAQAAAAPKTEAGPPRRTVAIVFGSDQGLVGQFNESIASHVQRTLSATPAPVSVWAVGERVQVRLRDAGLDAGPALTVPQSVKGITPLVGEILLQAVRLTQAQEASELFLFHNRPVSGSVCEPVVQRLLPLDARWRDAMVGVPWPTRNPPQVVCGGGVTLRVLIGEYLFVSLFRACAESLASENASRLAAMERADRNISELQGDLSGRFNRLRQSRIDEELFDVISGFEALASGEAAAPSDATETAQAQTRSNGPR